MTSPWTAVVRARVRHHGSLPRRIRGGSIHPRLSPVPFAASHTPLLVPEHGRLTGRLSQQCQIKPRAVVLVLVASPLSSSAQGDEPLSNSSNGAAPRSDCRRRHGLLRLDAMAARSFSTTAAVAWISATGRHIHDALVQVPASSTSCIRAPVGHQSSSERLLCIERGGRDACFFRHRCARTPSPSRLHRRLVLAGLPCTPAAAVLFLPGESLASAPSGLRERCHSPSLTAARSKYRASQAPVAAASVRSRGSPRPLRHAWLR